MFDMPFIDEEALAFFNGLSGRLHIELTEPAERATPRLENLIAPPHARTLSVRFKMTRFLDGEFQELTDDEWQRVVIHAPRIAMCSWMAKDTPVVHEARDGKAFTVRDLAACIAETERQGRDHSKWFGRVDVHHVFFEGISLEDEGIWVISWGS
jgi:hypothetical protein